jgi:uncharacterized protein YyaL (SSP411 family)
MPNRLASESSLYLRQHAENPVDWFPWGEEAFARAKSEDKPVLISIGYASCHWCHVMAHESFEDSYIAKLMNTHFVCIKVDREERPDVDQIYMDAVQMINGHGGWPLNVFCLPDGRPFAGGTYFPPDERRGASIVPWPQLLMRIADFYQRQRDDLVENARAIIGNLRASNTPHQATGDPVGPEDYLAAISKLLANEDKEFGGFGDAPKFPPSMVLDFLLTIRGSETIEARNPSTANAIDGLINRTLTAMAHGGLFDQIGGGFSRYSVDRHWQIPHFEKMLYDNALLIDIYSKAWQRYPKPLYKAIVTETIGWLVREMQAPSGAFYAALDADTNGEEGLTYLWRPAEVMTVLGEVEGKRFCEAYGISEDGNFEHSGRSHPVLLEGDPQVRASLAEARAKLLTVRNSRPQPGLDNKCLLAWNALLMRGLSRAAFTFGDPVWLELAIGIGHWIWSAMRSSNGQFHSVAYGTEAKGTAHLDDLAHSAEAFLALAAVIDWQHPGQSGLWLRRAIEITESVEASFADPAAVGYFFTSVDHEALIHRKKDWFDNALPAGNSAMARVFSHLHHLTGAAHYGNSLEKLQTAYPGIVRAAPAAAGHALGAFVENAIGIVSIKMSPEADPEALRTALSARPHRQAFLHFPVAEQTEAYQLCIGTQCMAPTNDLSEMVEKV